MLVHSITYREATTADRWHTYTSLTAKLVCDLAELKRLYGHKITLKGNLHTTTVMLHGSVADVVAASKAAIDTAAAGGRFVLSTGDQCGRDTPDENLRAMVETARTYGTY
jgi:uroporphyrinogen decarboxylase